ncbi:uncharacterized protein LOC126095466 [Schistocerca cancellata]|uniref:uncharacterized protein LOC126095466 n=1 Tax=Schistocerca cancellata TaxID=274614 RepID=UPI00211793F2|nr:uncharacterized protein LOC126095466 [Schistocerca cancellata]
MDYSYLNQAAAAAAAGFDAAAAAVDVPGGVGVGLACGYGGGVGVGGELSVGGPCAQPYRYRAYNPQPVVGVPHHHAPPCVMGGAGPGAQRPQPPPAVFPAMNLQGKPRNPITS